MEILPIIKYWIPHLQVLEPSWVRDIIKDNLEEYLFNVYSKYIQSEKDSMPL